MSTTNIYDDSASSWRELLVYPIIPYYTLLYPIIPYYTLLYPIVLTFCNGLRLSSENDSSEIDAPSPLLDAYFTVSICFGRGCTSASPLDTSAWNYLGWTLQTGW